MIIIRIYICCNRLIFQSRRKMNELLRIEILLFTIFKVYLLIVSPGK